MYLILQFFLELLVEGEVFGVVTNGLIIFISVIFLDEVYWPVSHKHRREERVGGFRNGGRIAAEEVNTVVYQLGQLTTLKD